MLWQFKHKARRKPTGDNIMTIAERLTEKIHSISYDELPSEAVYWTDQSSCLPGPRRSHDQRRASDQIHELRL